MEDNKKFLDQFKSFVINLNKTQDGNFIESLNEQIQQPTEIFLHLLCRKIDIKKTLFVDYDAIKDLKQTNDESLDNDNWMKVFYILAYWFIDTNEITIKYKALNTLLKALDLRPYEFKQNIFIKVLFDIAKATL